MTPSGLSLSGHRERRAAHAGDARRRSRPARSEPGRPGRSPRSSTEPAAPLRICVPVMLTPLMRVCAVKGTNSASRSCSSRPRRPYFSLASTTMLRPSGVSSAREESCAALASSSILTPGSGMNSTACRLPSVMVPVLSSSSVSTSPAASTALPDIARTLCCMTRSMPAMPMAESSPPMVVGIRQTSSEINTVIVGGDAGACRADAVDRVGLQGDDGQQEDDGQAGQQDRERDLVGRLLPLAPSTSAIIRSMKVSPGLEVIWITIRSDSTFVPPVTALRSPPLSRMTGADSPGDRRFVHASRCPRRPRRRPE